MTLYLCYNVFVILINIFLLAAEKSLKDYFSGCRDVGAISFILLRAFAQGFARADVDILPP